MGKCNKCWQHLNREVPYEGHKCPYRDCDCYGCHPKRKCEDLGPSGTKRDRPRNTSYQYQLLATARNQPLEQERNRARGISHMLIPLPFNSQQPSNDSSISDISAQRRLHVPENQRTLAQGLLENRKQELFQLVMNVRNEVQGGANADNKASAILPPRLSPSNYVYNTSSNSSVSHRVPTSQDNSVLERDKMPTCQDNTLGADHLLPTSQDNTFTGDYIPVLEKDETPTCQDNSLGTDHLLPTSQDNTFTGDYIPVLEKDETPTCQDNSLRADHLLPTCQDNFVRSDQLLPTSQDNAFAGDYTPALKKDETPTCQDNSLGSDQPLPTFTNINGSKPEESISEVSRLMLSADSNLFDALYSQWESCTQAFWETVDTRASEMGGLSMDLNSVVTEFVDEFDKKENTGDSDNPVAFSGDSFCDFENNYDNMAILATDDSRSCRKFHSSSCSNTEESQPIAPRFYQWIRLQSVTLKFKQAREDMALFAALFPGLPSMYYVLTYLSCGGKFFPAFEELAKLVKTKRPSPSLDRKLRALCQVYMRKDREYRKALK